MIEDAVFLVRVMGIGSGLSLIAMVVASEVRLSIRVPLLGVIVGVIGYLLNSTPLMPSDGPMDPWIDLVSITTSFWIWLFGRRLFEREPDRRILLATAAIMVGGWFLTNFLSALVPALGIVGFFILHLVSLALVADLVRVGIFERDDDLVEQRRIVRLWLPLLVAVQAGQILLIEVLEVFFDINSRHPPISLLNSVIILLIMLFTAITLFRTDPHLLPTRDEEQSASPEEPEQQLALSPSETVLHDKLKAAIEDGAYRQPGLTIAALADQLDTPEHRLRSLVNQRLGHRNFSTFLNRYRIDEARERLADREHVDLPVLTIAMDLGYNSLPTFNRAFRAQTGTTPSEYRREAIGSETAVPIPATPVGQN
ncbi:MAG: helix-turn-helix domain-containing protein [Pseudomonadota bacterium]